MALTPKLDSLCYNILRIFDSTLGSDAVENLSLMPSQHSVPTNLEIVPEIDLENPTTSSFIPHGLSPVPTPKVQKNMGICLRDS